MHGISFEESSYIGFGCVVVSAASDSHDAKYRSWEDVSSLSAYPDLPSELGTILSTLQQSGWVRIQSCPAIDDARKQILRVWILPHDVGLRQVDRSSRKLALLFERLLVSLDTSETVWSGHTSGETARQVFDVSARLEPGSLFHHFNTLPSPDPRPLSISEPYAREALEDILSDDVSGLKTRLFPYQQKSAGLMIERESVSRLDLDPRLEPRRAADGTTFYYDPWNIHIFKSPRYYETTRGGILAESMGLGKTVMCLALILATRWLPPRIPEAYALHPSRERVGSLADMAVSKIQRASFPWRIEFERLYNHSGVDMSSCTKRLEDNPATYDIPHEPLRYNRRTLENMRPPRHVRLTSATIVVVPRNLCKQWQAEIDKHVEAGVLRLLVMEDPSKPLPRQAELCSYDIILFSRTRFEQEDKDGADKHGRRVLQSKTDRVCRCPYIGSSRKRDCTCIREDMLYESPLKDLHFKRVIIDEGHFFGANSRSVAVSVAERLLTADHYWVVSGTPAKDLLGVEVDMSAVENLWSAPDTKDSRDMVLQSRRDFSELDKKGAIESLGSLATGFLRIRPWSDRSANAKWRDHVFRHDKIRQHTNSGYSTALRHFLENAVVKTQPEDVEKDVLLPPLESRVVKLQPSLYDKITANLFNMVLTANAVTSERSDADYLFHKNSQKARAQLISNLRQSSFFWTGFSEEDASASIDNSTKYLEKKGTGCSEGDRQLLTEAMDSIKAVPDSKGWVALSRSHEMGVFVSGWPSESAEHWAFNEFQEPLLVGITQLLSAQQFVNGRIGAIDPGEGLAGEGIKALTATQTPRKAPHSPNAGQQEDDPAQQHVFTKSGILASSLEGEPRRRRSWSAKSAAVATASTLGTYIGSSDERIANEGSSLRSEGQLQYELPERYQQAMIVGTASAKLSYLISQIIKYHKDEKILVFYQGENAAFYIAQMLDLLSIKHEIYAKSLKASMKAEYIVRFNESNAERVLLMDVQQAAFGLNLSSASRIYFVNPVYRPNVEAQAIKRAHRIGQTRKVTVETLVLQGSIEEKMLERSRRMTSAEHSHAKALEDDGGIQEIIQSARPLTILDSERRASHQMALLEEPQTLWGRKREFGDGQEDKGAIDPFADVSHSTNGMLSASPPVSRSGGPHKENTVSKRGHEDEFTGDLSENPSLKKQKQSHQSVGIGGSMPPAAEQDAIHAG